MRARIDPAAVIVWLQLVAVVGLLSLSFVGACDGGGTLQPIAGAAGASGGAAGAGGSGFAGGGAGSDGSAGSGGSAGTGGTWTGGAGGGSSQPACGTIAPASNNLVVTVNGTPIDFSDATVTFSYAGEGYHSVTLQKGDVTVSVRLTRSVFDTCPAVRTLPSTALGLPAVYTKNAAGAVITLWDATPAGASGTYTMIGYHVVGSPTHHTYGVAFSCADCVLPANTSGAGGAGGGASTVRVHGEVHLINGGGGG